MRKMAGEKLLVARLPVLGFAGRESFFAGAALGATPIGRKIVEFLGLYGFVVDVPAYAFVLHKSEDFYIGEWNGCASLSAGKHRKNTAFPRSAIDCAPSFFYTAIEKNDSRTCINGGKDVNLQRNQPRKTTALWNYVNSGIFCARPRRSVSRKPPAVCTSRNRPSRSRSVSWSRSSMCNCSSAIRTG